MTENKEFFKDGLIRSVPKSVIPVSLTFFVLMDFPKHANTCTISPFCVLRGLWSKFLNYDLFMSLKSFFILTNRANPDEMMHYAATHLGLHCLPMNLLAGIQNEKGI